MATSSCELFLYLIRGGSLRSPPAPAAGGRRRAVLADANANASGRPALRLLSVSRALPSAAPASPLDAARRGPRAPPSVPPPRVLTVDRGTATVELTDPEGTEEWQ